MNAFHTHLFIYFHVVLSFFLLARPVLAQQKSNGYFQSRVIDEQSNSIEGVTIQNLNSNAMTSTDSSGFFSIKADVNDSIAVYGLGYDLKKVIISAMPIPFITLKQIVFALKPANVYEFKNWETFKREFINKDVPGEKVNIIGLPAGKLSQKPITLRSNTFESKPGVLHFMTSPFSSLAYYTSRKEKEKRRVWRMMILDNQQSMYWAAMHRDSIKSWTNIPDSLIDDFIIFCNHQEIDKKLGSTYYFKEKISLLYPLFIEKRKNP